MIFSVLAAQAPLTRSTASPRTAKILLSGFQKYFFRMSRPLDSEVAYFEEKMSAERPAGRNYSTEWPRKHAPSAEFAFFLQNPAASEGCDKRTIFHCI